MGRLEPEVHAGTGDRRACEYQTFPCSSFVTGLAGDRTPACPSHSAGRAAGLAGGGAASLRRRAPPQTHAQDAVGACGHGEPATQACAGLATEGNTDALKGLGEPKGALGSDWYELRKAFGKAFAWSVRLQAAEAANAEDKPHREGADWQVARGSGVVTMDTVRRGGTHGTASGRGV